MSEWVFVGEDLPQQDKQYSNFSIDVKILFAHRIWHGIRMRLL